MTLNEYCEENGLEVLKANGFDDCVVGYTAVLVDGTRADRLVYDAERIIEKLRDGLVKDGVDPDEAYYMATEHFDFNIACAYVGPSTPLYLFRIALEET